MVTAEVILEDEITAENLVALFKRAFFNTSLGDDGVLFVKTDGPQVYVSVNEDHKLLRYMVVLGVKETAPLELKHELVNKMNDSLMFGRFSIPEHFTDRLVVDYSLPFEEGIMLNRTPRAKSSPLGGSNRLIGVQNSSGGGWSGRRSGGSGAPQVLGVFKCIIPFEEGIPAFQIVSALRRFARAVDYAIDNYDDEELIE